MKSALVSVLADLSEAIWLSDLKVKVSGLEELI